MISCNIHNTSDCYSTNSITINDDTLVTSITLPSHMFFTTEVTLKYESGQTIKSQNKVVISKYLFFYTFSIIVCIIGTHSIQDVISSIDVDKFCFQFQYVNGTMANKTHLQFVSANGNQNIIHNYTTWQLDGLECINTLPANNWTLYACDDELPCTLNPAVTVTDIVISALSISSDSIYALSSTHSSISLVSSIFLTRKESSFISDTSKDILVTK